MHDHETWLKDPQRDLGSIVHRKTYRYSAIDMHDVYFKGFFYLHLHRIVRYTDYIDLHRNTYKLIYTYIYTYIHLGELQRPHCSPAPWESWLIRGIIPIWSQDSDEWNMITYPDVYNLPRCIIINIIIIIYYYHCFYYCYKYHKP